MTHIARGLDSDSSLLLDFVASGYVPQLQSSADVNVKVHHLNKLLQISIISCRNFLPILCTLK